mmetsp:Transcript_64167/g.166816  ORF Transcript_64167/g.166816 Transcript_64167/m.166816 type:complete len:203 (+) Transcript_64167:300-908(+)
MATGGERTRGSELPGKEWRVAAGPQRRRSADSGGPQGKSYTRSAEAQKCQRRRGGARRTGTPPGRGGSTVWNQEKGTLRNFRRPACPSGTSAGARSAPGAALEAPQGGPRRRPKRSARIPDTLSVCHCFFFAGWVQRRIVGSVCSNHGHAPASGRCASSPVTQFFERSSPEGPRMCPRGLQSLVQASISGGPAWPALRLLTP